MSLDYDDDFDQEDFSTPSLENNYEEDFDSSVQLPSLIPNSDQGLAMTIQEHDLINEYCNRTNRHNWDLDYSDNYEHGSQISQDNYSEDYEDQFEDNEEANQTSKHTVNVSSFHDIERPESRRLSSQPIDFSDLLGESDDIVKGVEGEGIGDFHSYILNPDQEEDDSDSELPSLLSQVDNTFQESPILNNDVLPLPIPKEPTQPNGHKHSNNAQDPKISISHQKKSSKITKPSVSTQPPQQRSKLKSTLIRKTVKPVGTARKPQAMDKDSNLDQSLDEEDILALVSEPLRTPSLPSLPAPPKKAEPPKRKMKINQPQETEEDKFTPTNLSSFSQLATQLSPLSPQKLAYLRIKQKLHPTYPPSPTSPTSSPSSSPAALNATSTVQALVSSLPFPHLSSITPIQSTVSSQQQNRAPFTSSSFNYQKQINTLSKKLRDMKKENERMKNILYGVNDRASGGAECGGEGEEEGEGNEDFLGLGESTTRKMHPQESEVDRLFRGMGEREGTGMGGGRGTEGGVAIKLQYLLSLLNEKEKKVKELVRDNVSLANIAKRQGKQLLQYEREKEERQKAQGIFLLRDSEIGGEESSVYSPEGQVQILLERSRTLTLQLRESQFRERDFQKSLHELGGKLRKTKKTVRELTKDKADLEVRMYSLGSYLTSIHRPNENQLNEFQRDGQSRPTHDPPPPSLASFVGENLGTIPPPFAELFPHQFPKPSQESNEKNPTVSSTQLLALIRKLQLSLSTQKLGFETELRKRAEERDTLEKKRKELELELDKREREKKMQLITLAALRQSYESLLEACQKLHLSYRLQQHQNSAPLQPSSDRRRDPPLNLTPHPPDFSIPQQARPRPAVLSEPTENNLSSKQELVEGNQTFLTAEYL